jgi:hypothetical protein
VPRGRRLELLAAVCRIPLGFKVPIPPRWPSVPAAWARTWSSSSTGPCLPARPSTRCWAATSCVPTPPWSVPTWPLRPILACSPGPSTGGKAPSSGSSRPAVPPEPGCGIGAAQPDAAPTRSPGVAVAHRPGQAGRGRGPRRTGRLAELSAAEAARGAPTTRRTWRGLAAARVGSATPWTSWRPHRTEHPGDPPGPRSPGRGPARWGDTAGQPARSRRAADPQGRLGRPVEFGDQAQVSIT